MWIGLLLVYGDLAAFVKIAIFEAPVLYRYIWARTLAELFEPDFARLDTALALIGAAIVIGLVATGRMKRRALVWGAVRRDREPRRAAQGLHVPLPAARRGEPD